VRRQLGFIRCRANVGARCIHIKYLIDERLHVRFSRLDINRLSSPWFSVVPVTNPRSMAPPTDRKQILENFRKQIKDGRAIVGAGAGINLALEPCCGPC